MLLSLVAPSVSKFTPSFICALPVRLHYIHYKLPNARSLLTPLRRLIYVIPVPFSSFFLH